MMRSSLGGRGTVGQLLGLIERLQPGGDCIKEFLLTHQCVLLREGWLMQGDQVEANLRGMDDLDFIGWNNADWDGVFASHHTDDVWVDWKGQEPTRGIGRHIEAMRAYVDSAGGAPPKITSHPIRFGSGEWTCVVGEFEGGGRMVTVARWRAGAIAEEYIWA